MASQPKLGSGGRFRKLSASLAARGAHDPDALAAYIGRRKYGAAKMGRLSHHSHATPGLGSLLLADDGMGSAMVTCDGCGATNDGDANYCDNCGRKLPDRDTGSDDGLSPKGGGYQTPASGNTSTAGMNAGQIGVASGRASGALSNTGQRSVGLARRMPVENAWDVVVSRGGNGSATVRHRRGGATIGEIRRAEDGRGWVSQIDGSVPSQPRNHQRAALVELLAGWNKSATRPDRWAEPLPAARPPQQTPLMEQYGIPAVRTMATPATSASGGPRVTMANGDSDGGDGNGDSGGSGPAGLNAKGMAIYKKLLAKGFPAARALAFAKNSQNAKAGQFGKVSS